MVPSLFCSIIDFIISFQSYSWNFKSIANGFLFGWGLLLLVLYVYIVRVTILCGIVHYIQKARKAFVTDPKTLTEAGYDPAVTVNALRFQVCFLLHVVGQMIAQVFMLITVGRHIYIENPYGHTSTVHISPRLWYMFVAATVLPVFGVFTFFVVDNYWAQQFPIAFCLDLIKALKMPGADEMFDLKSISNDGALKVRNTILHFVKAKGLDTQLQSFKNAPFSKKFAYPFKTPGMVLLCALYLAAQLAFVSLAIIGENEKPRIVQSDWFALFYFIAGNVAFVINIHSFIVPLFWIGYIILYIFAHILSVCSTICMSMVEA